MSVDAQPQRSQVSVKTVLLVSLTVLAVVALAAFLVETRVAITITVTSALIATALHHGVDVLTRRRVPRRWAFASVIVVLLLAIVGFFLLIVPTAVQQGTALAHEVPKLMHQVRHSDAFRFLEARLGESQSAGQPPTSTLQATAEPALKVIIGLLGGLAALVTTFFLSIFMLIFGGRVVQAWLNEALPSRRLLYERVTQKIYDSVGGYLVGLGFICSVNATLTTTFLAIARVPFFFPLGIASGFSSLIPYGGPVVAGTCITLIALATKGPWVGLATAIYFILYGQLEGQILSPLVYRKTVDVDPLITLLAILFFAEFAGVVGAIIAVPAAAAGQIILRALLAIRRERLHF